MARRTRRLAVAGTATVGALAGVVAVLVAVVGGDAEAGDPPASRTTLGVPAEPARPGEEVLLSGRATTEDGSPLDGVRVLVQQQDEAGRFRTAQRVTAEDGRFEAWLRPDGDGDVRAVVAAGADHAGSASPAEAVRVREGSRSADERATTLDGALGARTDGSDPGLLAYEDGAVVTAGDSAWTVRGAIWDAYREVGGPEGAVGAPTGDAWCGPLGGCVQRFEGGAAYHEPGAPDPVEIVPGDPDVAAAEAAARTQIGYVEPHWRGSRWNDWVGDDVAWCGIFQSWASQAAGNGTAVPAARTFEDLVARTASDVGRHQAGPAIGSLAFMDLEDAGHPTHVGLVTGVDGADVHLVEGNVGPNDARAVVEMTRTDPPVDYYWLPTT